MSILLALALGCTGPATDGEPVTIAELSGCDPTDPSLCALPYPSSYYQVPADTVSGVRNAFPAGSLPTDRDGAAVDPAMLNRYDGFSTLTPMIAYFEGLSDAGLIPWTDPDRYLDADARTVVIDAVTGQRVAHFAELDLTADTDDQRTLILHALAPLEHGRRYVVAMRGLVAQDGAPVPPSPAFQALRDNLDSPEGDVHARRPHFEESVFPVLADAGIGRNDLQLAWDFTTASVESSLGRALHVRDDSLARLPGGPTAYVIDTLEDEDCTVPGTRIARTIDGHFTAPRYTLDDGPGLGARLVDGDDGMPAYQGDTEVDFLVRIPCSLALDPQGGGMVLQYGHGLLGSRDEARADYLADLADENRWVILAQDWIGMSEADAGVVALMIANDVSDFEIITDRSIQGLSEVVQGLRFTRSTLLDDPLLAYDGKRVIDPSKVGYYGNSQGGILGGAYMAYSPDIERGVLGVAGLPYSLLLSRSADFDPFFLLFDQKFLDDRDRALILAIIQTAWDPAEPAGYARHVTTDPLPGSGAAKSVLVQVALNDAQVTTLGAETMARAYGLSTVAPQTKPIWGIDEREAPFTGSAIVEWQYADVPEMPLGNLPPDTSKDPHECPRRQPEAQAQLVRFLETGEVIQTCDGVCSALQADVCP